MTDLHLDEVPLNRRKAFLRDLQMNKVTKFLITGDIANAKEVGLRLPELAAAVFPRPVYFLLGNHDFYGGSFEESKHVVADLCKTHKNLVPLGHGEIIPLSNQSALIGHRGWADGRMGFGFQSTVYNPDFKAIKDFKHKTKRECFDLLAKLGRESAQYFRRILPYALSCFQTVYIATHVPLFSYSAFFGTRRCDRGRLPYFVNISCGAAILRIAEHFPHRKIKVLAGHTHTASVVKITKNIEALTGAATPGMPRIEKNLSP